MILGFFLCSYFPCFLFGLTLFFVCLVVFCFLNIFFVGVVVVLSMLPMLENACLSPQKKCPGSLILIIVFLYFPAEQP